MIDELDGIEVQVQLRCSALEWIDSALERHVLPMTWITIECNECNASVMQLGIADDNAQWNDDGDGMWDMEMEN